LQERYNANQARKAFFEAFSKFQSQCPEIRKSKEVAFDKTKYTFATLADITRQINKPLENNGLNYRFEFSEQGDNIVVTCLISHVNGHTERTTMSAKADQSGAKNQIQSRGSTVTYLQRYTLIGALGITTADQDVDGRQPEYDVDRLHKDYMAIYRQVIQLDKTLTKYDPDNWKQERTGPVYVNAIKAINKVFVELQSKAK